MAEIVGGYQSVLSSDDREGDSRWLSPKSFIRLQPTDTQVWHLTASPEAALSTELLSPEELARTTRFKHAPSRVLFITARTALRLLLAHNLDADPKSIPLSTSPHGKPHLTPPAELSFNLAHSGDNLLIALTHNASIGIDLEQITPNPDIPAIAARMFHPDEAAALRSYSLSPTPYSLFFRTWSRKEAILKADGRGLSLPTTSFSTLGPTTAVDGTTFHLHDLPLGSAYAAALATTASSTNLRLYRFPTVSLPHL